MLKPLFMRSKEYLCVVFFRFSILWGFYGVVFFSMFWNKDCIFEEDYFSLVLACYYSCLRCLILWFIWFFLLIYYTFRLMNISWLNFVGILGNVYLMIIGSWASRKCDIMFFKLFFLSEISDSLSLLSILVNFMFKELWMR